MGQFHQACPIWYIVLFKPPTSSLYSPFSFLCAFSAFPSTIPFYPSLPILTSLFISSVSALKCSIARSPWLPVGNVGKIVRFRLGNSWRLGDGTWEGHGPHWYCHIAHPEKYPFSSVELISVVWK